MGAPMDTMHRFDRGTRTTQILPALPICRAAPPAEACDIQPIIHAEEVECVAVQNREGGAHGAAAGATGSACACDGGRGGGGR